jgi:hypothetical protein
VGARVVYGQIHQAVALAWLVQRVLIQMRLDTVILEEGVSQNRRFASDRLLAADPWPLSPIRRQPGVSRVRHSLADPTS